jgi:hypothetical protein
LAAFNVLPIYGTMVKGATTLNSVVDVWLGTTMLPSIDTFGTAVAAAAVQVGQFAAYRAIRPRTIIAVTVALWHRPADGRLRDGSRSNTLKITDCVNAFTLVFCEDAYGDGDPKPFRPSTNRGQP